MDPEIDFEGMTTNERLAHAGLLELFGKAEATDDRVEMIRLLKKAGFSEVSAVATADLNIEINQRRRRRQRTS